MHDSRAQFPNGSLRTLGRGARVNFSRGGPGLVVPAAPCRGDYAKNLAWIERLSQDIVSSKVQHFRPKRVVRNCGGHNEIGPPRERFAFGKQRGPISIRQFAFADHDRSLVAPGEFYRLGARLHVPQMPIGMTEDSLECGMHALPARQKNRGFFRRIRVRIQIDHLASSGLLGSRDSGWHKDFCAF